MIPNAIAANISIAVDSVKTRATITKAMKTIADTKRGLSISFCKAIENKITAIGITTKNNIIVKASIYTQPF